VQTPKVDCSLPQLQTLNDGRIQAKEEEEEAKAQKATKGERSNQPNKKKRYNTSGTAPNRQQHSSLASRLQKVRGTRRIDTLILPNGAERPHMEIRSISIYLVSSVFGAHTSLPCCCFWLHALLALFVSAPLFLFPLPLITSMCSVFFIPLLYSRTDGYVNGGAALPSHRRTTNSIIVGHYTPKRLE
jgi:hypothetical protein